MGPKKLKPRIAKSITKKKQDHGTVVMDRKGAQFVARELPSCLPTETNLPDDRKRSTSAIARKKCKDLVPWPATFGVDEHIEKWWANNKEWWKIKKHPFCKTHLALYFDSKYKCDCKGGEQRKSTVLSQPVESIDAVD